jgi:hypothetical protein
MDIEKILAKHEDRLLSLPNVVGVGIGERRGAAVIRVLVSKKLPADQILPENRIPKVLDGVETDVVEIGIPAALGAT